LIRGDIEHPYAWCKVERHELDRCLLWGEIPFRIKGNKVKAGQKKRKC